MKRLFENWREFQKKVDESLDKLEEDVKDVIIDVLKSEGGAADLNVIKKAIKDLDLPDGFDLEDFLKEFKGVGQHKNGDYILFFTKTNGDKKIQIKED